MPYTLTTKPLDWFEVFSQARKEFDEVLLRELGESLGIRQLQPVGALTSGRLLWGERRLRAAKLVGLKELLVLITDEPMDESQARIITLTENLQREDLSGGEIWQACVELIRLNPGWTNQELGAHLKKDPSSITRYMSPSKTIPEAQEALLANKIGIKASYELSKQRMDRQSAMLAALLGGSSAESAVRNGLRERRQKSEQTERPPTAPRIRIPLAINTDEVSVNGVATVSGAPGEEISLSGVEDILREALRAVRDAQKRGLTVKTFASAMRDMASH